MSTGTTIQAGEVNLVVEIGSHAGEALGGRDAVEAWGDAFEAGVGSVEGGRVEGHGATGHALFVGVVG